MKNVAGDCSGQTCSQRQENVLNIQVKGGVWVERQEAGRDVEILLRKSRTWRLPFSSKTLESHCHSKFTSSSASCNCMARLFHLEIFVFFLFSHLDILPGGGLDGKALENVQSD